ncbi:MAG: phosphomannomutase [Pseudomonadota bacterium]
MSDAVTLERRANEALACFKAYDIRGRVGRDLTAELAWRIGVGFAEVMQPETVVVGRDGRLSGPLLGAALCDGLTAAGVDVIDLGVVGTEEVYFAVAHLGAGAGVMVTASHNPAGDNGMKMVGPRSRPLKSAELSAIKKRVRNTRGAHQARGACVPMSLRDVFARHIVGLVDPEALAAAKLVVNAGHGVAGASFDAVEAELATRGVALDVVRLNHLPDGRFPKGVPNPLLPAMRGETAGAVVQAGAAMGVAWDGDFDRCFLFDERGTFVDGAYVVALLARAAIASAPGAAVLHDPRVVWPIRDTVSAAGGRARLTKTGHVHMKRAMHESGAVYGGEMSGHHYFRDFMCCDSGMLPWLKVLELMGRERATLADLVQDYEARHPVSGEMNYRVADAEAAINGVRNAIGSKALAEDRFDGVSLTFDRWRLNLRASSTEPLLRLNVETRADTALLSDRVAELDRLLRACGADRV